MSNVSLKQEVNALKKEVGLLRSAVIGIIGEQDPEGEYRPEFVKKVFDDLKRRPTHVFRTPKQFLKEVRAA